MYEKLERRWVRLQGGMQIGMTGSTWDYGLDTQGALSGALSFLPSPHFGLTGFYGSAYGVEMDLIPGVSSSGSVEFGLMFGFSRIAHKPWMEGVLPHIGTRLTWNVKYPWGVTMTARLSPVWNGYLALEGGLTFSL